MYSIANINNLSFDLSKILSDVSYITYKVDLFAKQMIDSEYGDEWYIK